MKVDVEKISGCMQRLQVQVPAESVDQAIKRTSAKLRRTTKLPGFRPGKVPLSLFERQFGAQIAYDAVGVLLDDNLPQAMAQAKLEPVAQPRIVHMGHLHQGQGFSYTAEVEVRPEIVLQTYEGLPVPAAAAALADADVDAALEAVRREHAKLEPVTDRTQVQEGDVVKMDYLGSLDGVPFSGGDAKDARIEVAPGQVLEDFWRGLVGAEVPGSLNVAVSFPTDYKATALAGQTAQFAMTLHELQRRVLPPLDDVLAVLAGADDLAALRASTQARLQQERTAEDRRSRRGALLKALVAANPMDVPPSMVTRQAEAIVERATGQIQQMMGKQGPLDDEMMQNLMAASRDDAQFQVHSALLLDAIGTATAQNVDDAALQARLHSIAAESQMEIGAVEQYFRREPDRLESLRMNLREDQVIDYLLARSTEAPPEPETKSEG